MKKIIQLVLLALTLSVHSYGRDENKLLHVQQVIMGLQANYEIFHPVNLFTAPEQRTVEGLGNYVHYTIDKNELQKAFTANDQSIELSLPQPDGTVINLLLTQHQILDDDFKFMGIDKNGKRHEIPTPKGIYYYGMIEGYNQRSMVACSIFNYELACVISNEKGNWNLGPMKGRENEYAYYNETTFHIPIEFTCGTSDDDVKNGKMGGANPSPTSRLENFGCLKIAFVADNSFYAAEGGTDANVFSYILAIFNVESIIYGNENVNVSIYRIYITYGWVYTSSDPCQNKNNFGFDLLPGGHIGPIGGDIQHLLNWQVPFVGGCSATGGLCFAWSNNYSGLIGDYASFPTYTQDAKASTHEDGHVIGSPHTHSCSWNGNGTKIDNCSCVNSINANISNIGQCITCTPEPYPEVPPDGGTIMSYCNHLQGREDLYSLTTPPNGTPGYPYPSTILVNGFGQQPGDVIRGNVFNASCLGSCQAQCFRMSNLAVEVNSPLNYQFHASNTMSGNSIVHNGATVLLTGGDSVVLRQGFNAEAGSNFTALIAPCTPAYRAAQQSNSSPSFLTLTGNENSDDIQISPNPFNSTFELSVNLMQDEKARMVIYNPLGMKVKELKECNFSKGINKISFDCNDLAPGVYLLELNCGETRTVKRIVKS